MRLQLWLQVLVDGRGDGCITTRSSHKVAGRIAMTTNADTVVRLKSMVCPSVMVNAFCAGTSQAVGYQKYKHPGVRPTGSSAYGIAIGLILYP